MSSYRNNNTNRYTKPVPNNKIIYTDQDLYVGQTSTGSYYLFHTTSDPAEKFKQRKIGDISQKPSKEFIEEAIRYGQNGEKIKWKLDKEKVEDWIRTEYKFDFSDAESPWAPKILGKSSASVPREPYNSDTEGDDDQPVIKKQIVSYNNEEIRQLIEKVESIFILVQEIATHLRLDKSGNGSLVSPSHSS